MYCRAFENQAAGFVLLVSDIKPVLNSYIVVLRFNRIIALMIIHILAGYLLYLDILAPFGRDTRPFASAFNDITSDLGLLAFYFLSL